MAKIVINMKVYSKNSKEEIKNVKAIKKDNMINFCNNEISSIIQLLDNKVILRRRKKEAYDLTLEFEENKNIKSDYYINDLNIKVMIETRTKSLIIKDNYLKASYDLYMNGEFSDSFIFELEWRDLK